MVVALNKESFKGPSGTTSPYITTHIWTTLLRLMGVPTSAVGYTAAMPRREDHEVHKDTWWGHWTNKKDTNKPVFLYGTLTAL